MNPLLSDHYDQMWKTAAPRVRRGETDAGPIIEDDTHKAYGLTLIARLHPDLSERIAAFLDEIQKAEPGQYYYPITDMHLTIMTLVSYDLGFRPEEEDISIYRLRIQQALQGTLNFEVHFRGVTASNSTVLLQGFPQDAQLQSLRDRFRSSFKKLGSQAVGHRYQTITAHSTVIRFSEALRKPVRFYEFLQKNRNLDFGKCIIDTLELVVNDRCLRKEETQILGRYKLLPQ